MQSFRRGFATLIIVSVFAVQPWLAPAVGQDQRLADFGPKNTETTSSLIPQPNQIEQGEGSYRLDAKTVLTAGPNLSAKQQATTKLLLGQLKQYANLDIRFDKSPAAGTACIRLTLNDKLPKEGYQLDITKGGIVIQASADSGLFYGWQTLMQLVLADSKATEGKAPAVELPCLSITDTPRFQWRGFMLDSARHFQKPDVIKRYLDLMAFYKFNRFHWHLTDDTGWRIQIDKYPKLTQVGAALGNDDQEVNGFYTKDDIREIVAYAKARFITIIPEIDMPGHATAAIFSYPELTCKEGPFKRGKPGQDCFIELNGRLPFCAGNDKAFTFLKDVLTETIALFDGPIHIGGDERPKNNWNKCDKCSQRMKTLGLAKEDLLQNWMMNEINKHILKHDRRSMAWAENIEGGVPEKQIIQAWHKGEDVKAVKTGHQVVNSIHNSTYLDYPSDKNQQKTHARWMRRCLLTLDKCYNFKPRGGRGLTEAEKELIIGLEACLWTETVKNDRLDFKTFPRLLALAEVAWTEKSQANYKHFVARLRNHCPTMKKLGIKYDDQHTPELK